MAARQNISRRDVLALPLVGTAAASKAIGATVALSPGNGGDQASLLCDHIKGLARALSAALAADSCGKVGVVVRPAGYADDPIAFVDLADAHDRAYSLSGALVQAICGHVAAYSALRRASRAADAVRLGRKPTGDELARLDRDSDEADAALMALCRYPARNGPERLAKARHLLAFAKDDELEPEHVMALLESDVTAGMDGELDPVWLADLSTAATASQ